MHGVAPHMCDQVVRPLLDQGAGVRPPGFLLLAMALGGPAYSLQKSLSRFGPRSSDLAASSSHRRPASVILIRPTAIALPGTEVRVRHSSSQRTACGRYDADAIRHSVGGKVAGDASLWKCCNADTSGGRRRWLSPDRRIEPFASCSVLPIRGPSVPPRTN